MPMHTKGPPPRKTKDTSSSPTAVNSCQASSRFAHPLYNQPWCSASMFLRSNGWFCHLVSNLNLERLGMQQLKKKGLGGRGVTKSDRLWCLVPKLQADYELLGWECVGGGRGEHTPPLSWKRRQELKQLFLGKQTHYPGLEHRSLKPSSQTGPDDLDVCGTKWMEKFLSVPTMAC